MNEDERPTILIQHTSWIGEEYIVISNRVQDALGKRPDKLGFQIISRVHWQAYLDWLESITLDPNNPLI